LSDCTIRIPQESGLAAGAVLVPAGSRHRAQVCRVDLEELREEGIFLPPVEKVCLELPPPAAGDNTADAGRLVRGLAEQYGERRLLIGLPVLRKLRRVMREKDFLVTATLGRPVNRVARTHVVNVQAGNWSHRAFALAVDIGTTTIQGQVIDLHNGQVRAEAGDYNSQIGYGEDVISRIIYAERPGGLDTMQKLVVGTVNGIIGRLLEEAAVDRDEIDAITVAGNTTMTHLFLGLEPHNIRRAPYVPVSTLFAPIRASDLGLALAAHAVVLAYPAISSYVGGDIVAGVMGSGMYRTEALTLFIDIGTNAEIVIGNRDWLACAACSAGPAFEGGGITHGMRAATGAIDDFRINPVTLEPMNRTIDRRPPRGICGSGLLILVATLFEHGIIDQKGRFDRNRQSPRLRLGRSGFEYVLAWQAESGTDRDIVLTEVDIQNFLRAKAAIYAGVTTLLAEVGLAVTDLDQIILAGAFGSYLDLSSAMSIGLLPEVEPAKVLYVGNGSLLGARMSAVSNHIRRDVRAVVRRMTSFELSEVPAFKEQYVASLFIPHTDASLFPLLRERLTANGRRPQPSPGSQP
ncbi:MAG: ASKHA domain-containing protein, partial [Thermodesulfobacteriota bacterium]